MTSDDDALGATAAATPSGPQAAGVRGPDAFRPGALIAERYRIVRLVGTGGMGEVYEADDLMLKERVAVKTVRGDVAKDETASARFKREIQLARRVTHANVCRIFDVGLAGDVPFVTMELCDGENLAARLKRGRMTPPEALPIVRQMVAALEAAHEAEIVHRDFKTANVMLVDRGGSRGVRAVVTDFGLARALETEGGQDQNLTREGGIMGSPGYMAPEQVEGKRDITAAVDIYALGVVLFEMVTGKLPFVGATPLETMTMRLKEPPPSPRALAPDLPQAWQDAILRCLAREPGKRFARVADLLPALTAAPSRRRLPVIAVAVAVVIALGGLIGVLFGRRSGPAEPLPAAVASHDGRPSVAILGFRNLGGSADADYLGSLLSEFLSTDLSAGDALLIVDAESVARARRELSLPQTDSFARDTLKKINGLLASDYVVVGSYLREGDKVHVDLKLQDARSGATVAAVTESGSKEEMVALVGRVGGRLRAKLGAGDLSAAQREGVLASLPRGADVQRLYAEGIGHLRVAACGAARAPLEQAVLAEPGFPLAHAALSETLQCLGFDGRAEEEAKRAVELSAGLPEEIRLAAEAQLHRQRNEWEPLLANITALAARRPDDPRVGQQLLDIQLAAGDIAAARATLARLRKLPGGDSAALDMRQVTIDSAATMIGEPPIPFVKRLEMLAAVRAKAEAQGAKLVVAEALGVEYQLYLALDDEDKALAAARAEKDILAASGDRDGVLQTLAAEVAIYQRRGDVEAVRKAHAQALATAGELDSTRSFAQFERSQAKALAAGGDLIGALEVYRELRDWCHARGKKEEEGASLVEIAKLQLSQADLGGAAASLAAARALGTTKAAIGFVEGGLALVRGDDKAARELFERELGNLPKVLSAPLKQMARDQIERELAAASGRWADLEAISRRLLERFAKLNGEDGVEPEDVVDLTIALLEQDKIAEARSTMERYAKVSARAARDHYLKREELEVLDALLQAASGKPADVAAAQKRVRTAIAFADKTGVIRLRLEEQLTLGRMQLKAGEIAAGRATIEAVIVESRKLGLGILVRPAERALVGVPKR